MKHFFSPTKCSVSLVTEPRDFGRWFMQKTEETEGQAGTDGQVGTLQALSLCETVEMDTNNAW